VPTYETHGVCSTSVTFDLDVDGAIRNIRFEGGCDGNAQGLARLAEGRPAGQIMALLSGVQCGDKSTSCPDQLARALEKHMAARQIPAER
jgi:uncharacterized protein (TIGR03905 family)